MVNIICTKGKAIWFIILILIPFSSVKCLGQNEFKNEFGLSTIVPKAVKIQFPINDSNGKIIYYLFSFNYTRLWKISEDLYIGPILSISSGITKVKFNTDFRKDDVLSSANYLGGGVGLKGKALLKKFTLEKKLFIQIEAHRQFVRSYFLSMTSQTSFPNTDYFSNTVRTLIEPNSSRYIFCLTSTYELILKKIGIDFNLGIIYVDPEYFKADLISNYQQNGVKFQDKKSIINKGFAFQGGVSLLF